MVWHITVVVWGVSVVSNCFSKAELYERIKVFVDNDIPFDVSWSKSVNEE